MNQICVLALVSLAALSGVLAGQEDENLVRQLCSHDKKAPEITKISQIRSMVERLERNPKACSGEVAAAIKSLMPLIYSDDVCSEKVTDAIFDYQSEYVNGPRKEIMPAQLKRFFIGFGVQVSKICKQALISQLAKVETEKGIKQEDFRTVTRAIEKSEQWKSLIGDDLELENLFFLLSDSKKDQKTEILALPPKEKRYFDLKREKCLNLFKPIYDALILPPVRLANIGFNYKGPSIAEDMRALTKTLHFETWINVILACEPVIKFKAIAEPVRRKDTDGNEIMVTILDDKDKLRMNTGLGFGRLANTNKPEKYKTGVKLNDQVIDEGDAYSIKSIGLHGQELKDLTKMRMKLVKRFVPLLKFVKHNKLIRFGLTDSATIEKKQSMFSSSDFKNLQSDSIESVFKLLTLTGSYVPFKLGMSTSAAPALWDAFCACTTISISIAIDYIALD